MIVCSRLMSWAVASTCPSGGRRNTQAWSFASDAASVTRYVRLERPPAMRSKCSGGLMSSTWSSNHAVTLATSTPSTLVCSCSTTSNYRLGGRRRAVDRRGAASTGHTLVVAATVLQLSDVHLTAAPGGPLYGFDPDVRLANVLDAWARRGERPDLVLLSGDNVDDGSSPAYRRLAAATGALDAPILAIAGNHDDPSAVAEWFGGSDVAEVGGWRVLGFDTSLPGRVEGEIDPRAVAERLDGLDARPTVVAMHHPPRSPSTHPWFQLGGSAAVLAVLAGRPHVRAVVSGHLHESFELDGPGGLRLLGAPSTMEPIDHHGDRYEAPGSGPTGAVVLELGDDGSVSSELLEA